MFPSIEICKIYIYLTASLNIEKGGVQYGTWSPALAKIMEGNRRKNNLKHYCIWLPHRLHNYIKCIVKLVKVNLKNIFSLPFKRSFEIISCNRWAICSSIGDSAPFRETPRWQLFCSPMQFP